MKKIYRLLIPAAIALASCVQEENAIPTDKKDVFYASVESINETRTFTDSGYKIFWSEDDRISVFEGTTSADQYKIADNAAGTKSCTFEYVSAAGESSPELELGHTIAYYPFDYEITCHAGTASGTYNIVSNLPETQVYAESSVGANSLPMAAVTTEKGGRELMFRNICGVLKLQIKGSASVKSVTLKGNDDEKLSGKAVIKAYADGTAPEIKMYDDASNTVTLSCGQGVQLSESAATDFLIVVPPVEFKNGFTVTLTSADGVSMEFKTSEKNPVNRAEVLKMPVITFEDGDVPVVVPTINDPGIAYMWDESVIPEITIKIAEDEWNKLLFRFDEFSQNVDYFHADFTYKKGSEVTEITDGGLRLRGNTSRRRPEGNYGEAHNSSNPDWHHCHFGINFRKFHKDSDHTIQGIRKVNLKWFKDDPNYVRELYCYDLFRRYGIWTAAFDVYCRVWLQVGNETPAYLGVFEMIEPIDDEFIERRVSGMFENDKGYLWKCGYAGGGPADLNGLDGSWSIDLDNGENYTYEFKGDEEDYESAKAQLEDFILKLTGKGEESFYKWIKEVCDVEFLLKTYAVNVACGMCDDHWNNGNNFYLYFNSTDKFEYQFFFLPYDYDNTLGTSWHIGVMNDPGRQDPYNWGDTGLLMERLMRFEEFRQIYKNALQELVAEENGLFHVDASIARIKAWQEKISPYVWNDTEEDMYIYDEAASWGNLQGYKLLTKGNNNFFEAKAATVNSMK